MKRLSFMSMYERNFVLRWVMSIRAAEDLAKLERFEFALVHFDPDPHRAIDFCVRLKQIQPHTRIVFFKGRRTELPPDFCADLVVDSGVSETELAGYLQTYIKQTA
jgi:hypothetical protein